MIKNNICFSATKGDLKNKGIRYIFFLFFCFSASVFAQTGYQIRIKIESITADSLFIKSYHVKSKKFVHFLSAKFEKDITFKDKIPLNTGIYIIEADSTVLSEFLISDAKNQKFTFSFLENDIMIEGSKENKANRAYMKQMMEFRIKERALETEFQRMQQKGLPNTLMQNFIDTFFMKLGNLYVEKRAYQEKTMAENKGLLLASIIQCSIEVPPPPQEYYRSQSKYLSYMAEHFFDAYMWDDERLLQTPVLYNKFKAFAQNIVLLETEKTVPIVLKALHASKKNKNLYLALFDFLEHELGSYKSPYRDVLLYIEMLKDILKVPDLEETRKLFYEYELKLISKNHEGDQAIDFKILLSNGDTTNLYDVEAEILLLYFQNPDCPTCGEFREKMKNMEALYKAISSGKLKVLTIYFEDKEELWRNYLKTRAFTNWSHGWNYDLKISEERLYDVRNIPTIMILDKNKKVIKKDIFPNELEEWLKRNL